MGDFNLAYKFTTKTEGGYSNRKNDLGGETNYGISNDIFIAAKRAGLIDSSLKSVKDITPDDARTILKKWYWDKIYGDELPDGLSVALFDSATNAGVPEAVKLLQKILNVPADGIVGPETLQTIDNYKGNLVDGYLAAMKQRYETIVKKYPDQLENMNGWLNRLNGLKNYINNLPSRTDDVMQTEPKGNIIGTAVETWKEMGLSNEQISFGIAS